MSPERLALRLAVNQAVRARIAAENDRLQLCSTCRMPMSDWTPGCKTCWNRHRNYETGRTRCPYVVDPNFYARMRMIAERWNLEKNRERSERRIAAQGGRTVAYL